MKTNRQKRFRERKDTYTKMLEEKVSALERECANLQAENTMLKSLTSHGTERGVWNKAGSLQAVGSEQKRLIGEERDERRPIERMKAGG
jgi:hypothetical protein